MKKIILILFVWTVSAYAFQFAWLTDTHVGGRNGAELLREAVKDVNSMDSIDFVIVSGDLTEADINGYLKTAKEALDELHVDYYVIPGNHELKWSNSGGRAFEEIFGYSRFLFEKEGVCFCGLHQGPIMKMGFGFFYPHDLKWVNSMKEKIGDKPVVWITHYPIDPSVTNYMEFLVVANQFHSAALLHGHGHSYRVTEYEGLPAFMCRSTLLDKEGKSGYALVEISEGKGKIYKKVVGEKGKTFWVDFSLKKAPIMTKEMETKKDESVLWEHREEDAIIASPSLSDKYAVVATYGGKLALLDLKDGALLWEKELGASVVSTPILVDNSIFAATCDSTVFCFQTETGDEIWKTRIDGAGTGDLAFVDKTLLFGCGSGTFYRLDSETGKTLWKNEDGEEYVESLPCIHENRVYYGAWDGFLRALDIESGHLIWKWKSDMENFLYSPAACIPFVSKDQVVVVTPERAIYSIDSETGNTTWKSKDYKVRESLGGNPREGVFFARCMEDTLCAYEVKNGRDPVLKWAVDLGFGYDINPAAPVATRGKVIFSTHDGSLFVVSQKDGALIKEVELGTDQSHRPVLTKDGRRVCVTGMDGNVYLIKL